MSVETYELHELMDTPKYLKQGVGVVKTVNDYLIRHKETPEVNWKVVGMVKGANFGEYYKMRNEGSQAIANHILLEEGLPQRLSPKQETFLTRFDKQYKL